MGISFDNVLVRAADPEWVMAALSGVSTYPCSVAEEPVSGWVLISLPGREKCDHVAAQLSHRLRTETLRLWMYDSDIWGYSLFRDGEKSDAYDSNPHYFTELPDEFDENSYTKVLTHFAALRDDPTARVAYAVPGVEAGLYTLLANHLRVTPEEARARYLSLAAWKAGALARFMAGSGGNKDGSPVAGSDEDATVMALSQLLGIPFFRPLGASATDSETFHKQVAAGESNEAYFAVVKVSP